MTILTEGQHTAEFIVSEANGARSRATGTLVSGEDLAAGTVLGVITASGKWTQFNQDAADGSETAAAVLYAAVDASGGDADAVAVVRDAEVNGAELVWPSDIEAGEKTDAIADLANVGVIVR